MAATPSPLAVLHAELVECRLCPRLVSWREEVARVKRAAYRDWTYWGRPVPGFGDPTARVALVGLAPGAHGANRTGRMFTGDRSGDFLYPALHDTGFATQPTATHATDGLRLTGCFLVAALRCVPPDNKPLPEELRRCRPYLVRELAALPQVRVVVALGKIGWDSYLAASGEKPAGRRFAHGSEHQAGGRVLLGSYHPSLHNTSTGRLTPQMLRDVLRRARELAGLAG